MQQNQNLIFSSRYRQQRTWTTSKRSSCRCGDCRWRGYYSWPTSTCGQSCIWISRPISWQFGWLIVWSDRIASSSDVTFCCYWNYRHVSLYVCRYISIYTCTNSAQCRSCLPSASQHSSRQQSAVNFWIHYVNKYVHISSSDSGRSHNDRALFLIWAWINPWFNTLFELHSNNFPIYNLHTM